MVLVWIDKTLQGLIICQNTKVPCDCIGCSQFLKVGHSNLIIHNHILFIPKKTFQIQEISQRIFSLHKYNTFRKKIVETNLEKINKPHISKQQLVFRVMKPYFGMQSCFLFRPPAPHLINQKIQLINSFHTPYSYV